MISIKYKKKINFDLKPLVPSFMRQSMLFCQIQDKFGEKATTLITELVRDNREIIGRIPKAEIDRIVGFVKQHKVPLCFAPIRF